MNRTGQRGFGSSVSTRGRYFWLLAVSAAMFVGLTAIPGPGAQNVDPDHRPLQISADSYVSSDSCRECHPKEYQSWRRSFHRTMTQVATPRSVRVSFAGSVPNVHGRPMDLEQRGDELWATFDNPDTREHGRITRQVVLTTGSHQQQQFWYATGHNRLLGKLPGAFLIDSGTWNHSSPKSST